MIPETLTSAQRAILLASQARRIKARQLEHYQQVERAAAAPDYFGWADHKAYCVHRAARLLRALHSPLCPFGADPRDDTRGMDRYPVLMWARS